MTKEPHASKKAEPESSSGTAPAAVSKAPKSAECQQQERELALGCWYLTGATASGKSDISIALAKTLDAEIISLDSMAIYRGMDIGTAKPDAANREAVPHHLIDIIEPVATFSVSQYRESALQTIREIQGRGRQVLFVGGTALYLKALLRGLFDGPPADWEFRDKVLAELNECDADELVKRLMSVDPVSAHKLHRNDRRRIIRALEVYYQTGTPISHWQTEFENVTPAEQCRVFTVRHPRPILHSRIEQRVITMFEAGLLEEVEGLLEKWQQLSHTAEQAVGYREAIEFLRGERDRAETIEKVMIRTRRFARHQETWFRGLTECRIVDIQPQHAPADIANTLYELGS